MNRQIVERTRYFGKPGMADAVLETRREASRIRAALGLPHGRITVPIASEDGVAQPDVEWECTFNGHAERDADMKARADSAQFEAIRQRMGSLLDRFERLVYEVVSDPNAVIDLSDWPVVPERVSFAGNRGELTGFLYLPPGERPLRCMVVNHGSTVTPDSTDICKPSVAAALAQWNIACFFPNRWGYGQSPGHYWRDEVTEDYGTEAYDRQLLGRLDSEADDVVSARRYLLNRPEIDAQRIGVMGSSFGGTVSLLAAAKDPEFRCMIDFAGAAMNWEKAPKLACHMIEAAGRLTQPSYLIQAENDYSIGPTLDIARHLDGSEFPVWSRVFPGFGLTKDEGHLFERHGTAIWGPHVRAFLDLYL